MQYKDQLRSVQRRS